ncbi:hypothetical protein KUCAC02_000077 [Chaenocephalus aceratus]|nr:hypothetical protein KUCAC02_000077 [Chaenocephalus aceratus]
MPGMVVFGRRWGIASDDLVFPGSFELFVRVLWWIGTMILFTYHKGNFDCYGGGVLHTFLVGLMVVLALIILSLCATVCTITNPGPRRSIPALIYLRAILYIPELVWACLGAMWVSADSKGCDPATVGAVISAVIASWIILLFTGLGVVFVFDPLGKPPSSALGHGASGSQGPAEHRGHAVPVHRSLPGRQGVGEPAEAALLLPAAGREPPGGLLQHRTARRGVLLSWGGVADPFARTQTWSPVTSQLVWLCCTRSRIRWSRAETHDVMVDHSPSSPLGEDLETELEEAAHCMQFAAAAYGWPMYIYSNPLTGPCRLSGDCCRSREAEYDIVGGDHLGCHFSSILQSTGLQYRDFIYVSFHNQIYEIPFYVALDHKREAVLVAVRGTLSLKDVLTDLSAECENLPVEGVLGSCYAHKGICQAAGYIYKKLVNDGILNQAFCIAPEYKLVITGHSLGAGTASLLAILLRNSFPTLQCYSFSPPGGLLSKALADYSKDFVVSVVLGKDLVPRLSLPNMEDLKRKILKVVSNCNKPKYRILLQGCWYEVFGGDPDDFPTEMDNRREEELSQPLLGEESLMIRHSSSYQSLASDESPAHTATHLPLFLPGRILRITEDGPSRRFVYTYL